MWHNLQMATHFFYEKNRVDRLWIHITGVHVFSLSQQLYKKDSFR